MTEEKEEEKETVEEEEEEAKHPVSSTEEVPTPPTTDKRSNEFEKLHKQAQPKLEEPEEEAVSTIEPSTPETAPAPASSQVTQPEPSTQSEQRPIATQPHPKDELQKSPAKSEQLSSKTTATEVDTKQKAIAQQSQEKVDIIQTKTRETKAKEIKAEKVKEAEPSTVSDIPDESQKLQQLAAITRKVLSEREETKPNTIQLMDKIDSDEYNRLQRKYEQVCGQVESLARKNNEYRRKVEQHQIDLDQERAKIKKLESDIQEMTLKAASRAAGATPSIDGAQLLVPVEQGYSIIFVISIAVLFFLIGKVF